MSLKKIIAILLALVFVGVATAAVVLVVISSDLPQIITVEDYEPLLVSEVYDRNGEKIGEFFREKRKLIAYDKIPQQLIHAFVSAEDSSFFEHGGINLVAIARSVIANIKAGRRVQGGSTITQQVARSLLLTRDKTYKRKIKEAILAYRMEQNLSKEEILYLYLNQIYLGQGAWGIGTAAEIYYRKPVEELQVEEMAILAGLPQAPSRYSPIYNPQKAKSRQKYVLRRMAEEEYITEDEANEKANLPVQIYVRKDYKKLAPYYLETVRQLLVEKIGESQVLDKGIKIYTGLDLNKQLEAQKQVREGLRKLDKRQGYRGAAENMLDKDQVAQFLLKSRNNLMDEISPVRVLQPDGTIEDKGPLELSAKDKDGNELPNIPHYISMNQVVPGIVTNIDDKWGIVQVRFAENKGMIDFETMKWAREPDPNVKWNFDEIDKPSEALNKGDVIQVRIIGKKFVSSRLNKQLSDLKRKKGKKYERPEDIPEFDRFSNLVLEQEPVAEAALVSFDQDSEEIIAMVGGYNFAKSEFNRTLQAARQTGSAFKSIVYTSALDKNFSPSTAIIDAPVVFEDEIPESEETDQELTDENNEVETKKWKPLNHSKKFMGDILFRNALIRSLNIPTVKVIEGVGVKWVSQYARRLGIFSPLNMDYTLALGSSGITLFEMTKVFSQLGRLGKRIRPIIIQKVESKEGEQLVESVSLDERFKKEITNLDEKFAEKRLAFLSGKKIPDEAIDENSKETDKPKRKFKQPEFYFEDEDQLIRKETAYVATSLLKAVVTEPGGTGGRAKALGRPVAGKTGTTNGYFDAWFLGFTPQIATGVWVGYDEEKTLGRGEVGGRSALPIWLEYMKMAHEGLPITDFKTPEGIVFANIDNKTGKLASADSKDVIRQAFIDGTEPQELNNDPTTEDDADFYKEDLAE